MTTPGWGSSALTFACHRAFRASFSWLAALTDRVSSDLPRDRKPVLDGWAAKNFGEVTWCANSSKWWQQGMGRSNDGSLKVGRLVNPFGWSLLTHFLPDHRLTLWLFSLLAQLLSVAASVTQQVWPVSGLMSPASSQDPPCLLRDTERH